MTVEDFQLCMEHFAVILNWIMNEFSGVIQTALTEFWRFPELRNDSK